MSEEKSKSELGLRIIAIFKLTKSLLFIGAGLGVLHFLNRDVQSWLLEVMNTSHINPMTHRSQWALDEAGQLTKGKLEWISALAFTYGTLFAVEGLGLYFRQRWAEYLVVVMTASLLPVEIYELCRHVSWIKISLLSGNLVILGYLVWVIWSGRKK
jgi:uncharacterized membrane protein (DUF2068 family)